MSIEQQIDALYQGALDDFVTARNELAKSLKKPDREASDRVKALAKPSVSAWVVNQLYWRERRPFQALLAAGAAAREGHSALLSGGGGTGLSKAVAKQREALNELVNVAEKLLVEQGSAASPAMLRRIGTTLEALAMLGEGAAESGLGRMAEDLDPPGFDALGLLAASLPSAKASANIVPFERSAAKSRPAHDDGGDGVPSSPSKAPEKPAKLSAALLQQRREAAQAQVRRAAAVLARAREASQEAQRDLKEAETHEREARKLAEQAARGLEEARRTAERAEKEANEARDKLDGAQRELDQVNAD